MAKNISLPCTHIARNMAQCKETKGIADIFVRNFFEWHFGTFFQKKKNEAGRYALNAPWLPKTKKAAIKNNNPSKGKKFRFILLFCVMHAKSIHKRDTAKKIVKM